MTEEESLEVFEQLEQGDKILFNDRKVALEVSEVEEDRAIVQGQGGGEYEVFVDEGTLLWSKKGNRRYSSYCNDLRKVGEWSREGDTWKHSKTGSKIVIEKNEIDYWTISSEDFDLERSIELPRYGYNDREEVVKEVEKFIEKHPEG
jgi:hypothetical protein